MTEPNSWLALLAGPLLGGLAVLVLVLAALTIWMLTRMRRLERHYRRLISGTRPGNLQAVLDAHLARMDQVLCELDDLSDLARSLEEESHRHLQHVALLRFNPFRDTGGDQSFALAVADADGNGAVMSSLHNRESTRVYGKPLQGWKSAYPLTEEEAQAIERAQGMVRK